MYGIGLSNFDKPIFLIHQQKSPTTISGEMNASYLLIKWGFKPYCMSLNHPADATNFLEVIYRAELDKWAQIRRGEFDKSVFFANNY